MPQISVIVPVYKVEKYLNRCVDSILNQTFKDFEIILVDDGSPDNCPAICDDYAAKYDFVHVIHKENGGLSDARNYGIDWAFKNSDSEWITFIDSDDWVHKQYLELLYNACVTNNVEITCSGIERLKEFVEDSISVDNNKISVDVDSVDNLVLKKYVFDQFNISTAWARLYKKELWENIRFPYGRLHEDEFTTYKVLFLCDKIAVVNYGLYYYFRNENGIMKSEYSPKRIKDLIECQIEQIQFLYDKKFINSFKYKSNSFMLTYKRVFNAVKADRQAKKILYSYLYVIKWINKVDPSINRLAVKYGVKRWFTGRAWRISLFKCDVKNIRKNNGFMRAMFYYFRNFYSAYMGRIDA